MLSKKGDIIYCQICGIEKISTVANQIFCSPKCANSRTVLTPEDIWNRIDRSGGEDACWPWLGAMDKDGYGKVRWNREDKRVHRLVYEFTTGDSLGIFKALHTCDNPPCCNPKHIFKGTTQINNEDKRLKKRHTYGEAVNTATLTPQEVLRLRKAKADGENVSALCRILGISKSAGHYAASGKSWKYLETNV